MNMQGVEKNARKSNQTKWWSAHFVKIILDNVGENFYHMRGIQRLTGRYKETGRFSFPMALKLAVQRIK